MALSLSDPMVWCYTCSTYVVDDEVSCVSVLIMALCDALPSSLCRKVLFINLVIVMDFPMPMLPFLHAPIPTCIPTCYPVCERAPFPHLAEWLPVVGKRTGAVPPRGEGGWPVWGLLLMFFFNDYLNKFYIQGGGGLGTAENHTSEQQKITVIRCTFLVSSLGCLCQRGSIMLFCKTVLRTRNLLLAITQQRMQSVTDFRNFVLTIVLRNNVIGPGWHKQSNYEASNESL